MIGQITAPQPITFTEKDAAHTGHPHILPLYITNYIEDFEVHKVLVLGCGIEYLSTKNRRDMRVGPVLKPLPLHVIDIHTVLL